MPTRVHPHWQALYAAGNATGGGTVAVGAEHVYYMHPCAVSGVRDVTLRVDGLLRAHDNISAWPMDAPKKNFLDVLSFTSSSGVHVYGNGTIDGVLLVMLVAT